MNEGINFVMDVRQFRRFCNVSLRAVIILLRFHVHDADMRSNGFEIIGMMIKL